MGKTISFVSGKGGVGKTFLVANLGIALSKAGFNICMIDTDIAMANLSLLLGMQSSPITLHDVLLEEAVIEDAIYDGPANTKFIPSGLSLDSYRRVDSEKLVDVISSIKKQFDFILLDGPAGIGKDVMASISAAETSLLITMPISPAIADLIKTKKVCLRLGNKPLGVIINFARFEKGEINEIDVSKMLELPIYGVIPFDDEVRKTFLQERVQPVILRKPSTIASTAIFQTVKKLTGREVKIEQETGFLGLFKKTPSSDQPQSTPQSSNETKKMGLIEKIISFFKKK